MQIEINYLGVVLCAVMSMVIGFLWYGVFFKKQWMELMGITPDGMKNMKMTANQAYAIQFVASLVMAYMLEHFLIFANSYIGVWSISAGLVVGFWAWLGFIVPTSLSMVLWEGKSWKLWFLVASNWLVTLVLMGIILSVLA